LIAQNAITQSRTAANRTDGTLAMGEQGHRLLPETAGGRGGHKGENGKKNPLTIFTHISFYLIGNSNRKVRNGIRSVKSGASKTDKSEQKCLGIDRQTVI
jgi:hypothetical protein